MEVVVANIVIVILLMMALSITMIVHEMGHFIVALKCGIKASEIGFGFKIPGKPNAFVSRSIRGIRVSINPIPLGAFVELSVEEINALGSTFKKIAIFSAGSISNIVFSMTLFVIAGIAGGYSIINAIVKSIEFFAFLCLSIINIDISKDLTTPIGIVGPLSELFLNNLDSNIVVITLALFFALILSLNLSLGIINLIPVPPLDGGRILFIILERIFGKKIKKIHAITTASGVIAILILSVLLIIKDIIGLL